MDESPVSIENLMIRDLGLKIANLEVNLAQSQATIQLLMAQQQNEQAPEEGPDADDTEDTVSP